MKIENKIILSNVFHVSLIIVIGLFAFQNLNLILTKLRFVEIADDLNASFLEMRLSEKNYFLYRDGAALSEIEEKIGRTTESLGLVREDISRAIGEKNLGLLKTYLRNYSGVIEEIRRSGDSRDAELAASLRAKGKRLKEFSDNITHIERTRVNEIISDSKRILLYAFWATVLSAILVSHFVSQKILRSLRAIERLARTISDGNFHRIEGIRSNDEFGSVISAINSMSDELRDREEQIIQSKKLASLGVLTAGVAHELTNPLNNISMIAQNYLELYDYLSRENRIELMEKVEGEAKRIGEIVKNLLDFSKPQEPNLREADINDLIRGALKLTQNTLDISNIETSLLLAAGLPPVFVDEHQVQQVLVNLIVNAVQAMSPGGLLSLRTRLAEDSRFVRIDVQDTGKGIPPEFLPHIFDPFFSTKGVGGTGLGLSVSYGIIKKHRGIITVKSEAGNGTTFTIELPVDGSAEQQRSGVTGRQ